MNVTAYADVIFWSILVVSVLSTVGMVVTAVIVIRGRRRLRRSAGADSDWTVVTQSSDGSEARIRTDSQRSADRLAAVIRQERPDAQTQVVKILW